MEDWKRAITDEWNRRQANRPKPFSFPLVEQAFDADEIVEMAEVLLSGQLTMSNRVREFEKKFAEFVGAPYAVMVNSGSSANLLAAALVTNLLRDKKLEKGDEILVPAVCWSTSVWPLVQMGLKPIFVDVDPRTLNVSIESLKAKASARTRAFMAVHILGNCAPMDEVLAFVRERDWILIEDTCESLGTKWKGKYLGTMGEVGTYSFYFSHHMTTGEGGMVVCHTLQDYDLLKCLRAHGWTRELSNRAELERDFSNVDPRFLFVNVGFNLRPMEIQAALGVKQLAKLPTMNANRVRNRQLVVDSIQAHPKWKGQLEFPEAPAGADVVWFGFSVLLKESVSISLREYLEKLSAAGIENRPIVSGNFARQPGYQLVLPEIDAEALVGAERIHERGFFIGVHSGLLTKAQTDFLADTLLRDL